MKKKLIISIFLFFALSANSFVFADNVEKATKYYNDAIDLYKQNDINGSVDLFKKAIELKTDFYEAYYNLAQILMSVDKNEEALKSLEELVKLNPKDSESLYNIGKIQYKRGYLSNSHKYLSMIQSDMPQYESAKILIEKIEKRQKELNLENLIKNRKNTINQETNLATSYDLVEIQAPSGVATDSDGNIYVASFSENTIYKVSSLGKKTVFSNSSLIKGPIGIATDSKGNIYIANYSANNILKITPTGVASIYSNVQKPYCIFYEAKYNRLYITEQQTNKIIKLDL